MSALATAAAIGIACALVTVLSVGCVRVYALRRAMLDQPDARRTNEQATPRGAGVSFLFPLCAVGLACMALDLLPAAVVLAWMLPGVALAAVGWMDDHRPLSIRIRLAVQLLGVLVMFYLLGVPQHFGMELFDKLPGWTRLAGSIVCVLWLINVFNFMDGVDGFAAAQGLFTALGGGVLLALQGQLGLSFMCLAMAGVCAGFLVWNWAPARIFMGDSGSYTLGMYFGFIAVAGQSAASPVPLSLWAMLMAPFIWDASCTLLSRMRTEPDWLSAHRDHAFQLLHERGLTHAQISIALVGCNLIAVWPLVALAYCYPRQLGWVFTGQAIIMLALWIMIRRSGRHGHSKQDAQCE